ncbi:MAG: hypothetical protein KIT00_06250 [Rhodospirillales bacterium]|nr:hypothetical protein [Rhodospirillales bacterium]
MVDSLNILGIHDGHNCGATLVRDGVVVASICEERLSRRKNECGYPRRSIERCLAIGGIDAHELDDVVYASLFMHRTEYLTDLEPWYLLGIKDQRKDAKKDTSFQSRLMFEERHRERIDAIADHLGVPGDRVSFVEHHLAHLAAAYYTAPNIAPGEKVLGLTCDGAGDGVAATVSLCHGNTIERIAATDRHASLGKIYSRVTMLMGMKPWEHEYKIMGLAPYADPERSDRAAEALRALIRFSDDGLSFVKAGELSTNYCYEYLVREFERVRFDTIAGATQLFAEEMLTAWVKSCVEVTGRTKVVCGGGVFMNVKANMLIAQMPEVDWLYVMPSCADESLSIGAALHRCYERTGNRDHNASVLRDLYLGDSHDRQIEEQALAAIAGRNGMTVQQSDDPDADAVEFLAHGDIIARCRDRMEWGARALGNRSIITSADDPRAVERINRAIKQRDFWMPFAPSVLAESASRYFDDPKDLDPRFMTFAFPSKPETQDDLIAAAHPHDRTIRPQRVTRDANPAYHRLLERFQARTGRGIVLNTSFNIHGEPMADSPFDAVDIFLRSDLDHLILDHHVISRRSRAPQGRGAA